MNKRIKKKKQGKISFKIVNVHDKDVDIFIPKKYYRDKYRKTKRIEYVVAINDCTFCNFRTLSTQHNRIYIVVREMEVI